MITLQCKLSPEDYIQAQRLHMRLSPFFKYVCIALLSLCLVVFAASAFSLGSLTAALSGFDPIFVFVLILSPISLFVIMPWNARRIFLQQKTLQAEYQIIISPEMIEANSEYGTTRIPLSNFYKYKVGKDLILLYHSQMLFHIFPRRFFTSEDFKTFLSYLEAHLGSPQP